MKVIIAIGFTLFVILACQAWFPGTSEIATTIGGTAVSWIAIIGVATLIVSLRSVSAKR